MRYASATQIVIMLLAALAAARLIWSVVTPVGPFGPIRPAEIELRTVPEFVGLDRLFGFQAQGDALAVSSAGLELYGIRMDRASGRGSAILGGESVLQQSFTVGEEVAPGIVLTEVRFDNVVLTNQGVREALFLDQSSPATPVGNTADSQP